MRTSAVENKMTVLEQVLDTGLVPCIKTHQPIDYLAYAQAMYDGGARVMEVTLTSHKALEAIESIASRFEGRMYIAAGTVLTPRAVREVTEHGGNLIVTPTMRPQVLQTAASCGVPIFCGAFTASECQSAMDEGAAMIKIFPASVGGPGYMTNLRMILPDIKLIPSGGVNPANAAEYIRCGASAVSGARTFMDHDRIEQNGLGWLSKQVSDFIKVIGEAKKNLPPLP